MLFHELQASVLTCILHTEVTTVAWALGLKNLNTFGPIALLSGSPYDMSRNMACMRCLEGGFSHIFFLDSDVIAPADAVQRLLAHKKPIISGLYCRRSPPEGVPVCMKPVGQWITKLPNIKKGENPVIDVDVVGAGCLLIAREVLETLPPQRDSKHWFDWRVDMRGSQAPGGNLPLSEDFTMCLHAKNHGYQILVDTSIVCKHIGLAESQFSSFKPLGY